MTVHALVRALPLMSEIVGDLPSLYINGLKIEHAAMALIKNDPRLLEEGQSSVTLCHDIADHCMFIAKFLRLMKSEDERARSDARWQTTVVDSSCTHNAH